ncbi:SUMO-activating enzyme subunit 2 [Aethina tumida]|uniref:SUMO-activating enzyme subunit 2 n=1 Tax=Aethina tumida TaxID=116153 RepID=UPI00096B3681|nr:SUMO-activating enzyme subunit 2 [Aethina tumida]
MSKLSRIPKALPKDTAEAIHKSKILVVGAGGIGCEVLKNLALTGFPDIEVIDLDTIDVSNLNRQFLFRKEHVGKSKAQVAKESILGFNPNTKVEAHHDSVTSREYGVNYFKQFSLVINALDNRAARSHVNRVCLAADVPLIESGTAGYFGQVELIKRGMTQCYECHMKAPQKSFPGCTIRNTPSEPVHCIVWAKHLFNQLFGEDDPDQDVSPDAEDPEAKKDGDGTHSTTETGNVVRVSTRQWVQDVKYDPAKLFNKFFHDDIKYLLTMENLWKTRRAPVPLNWEQAASHGGDAEIDETDFQAIDTKVWSLKKCTEVFADTIKVLKKDMETKEFLVWDKDDEPAMDFVTAAANIRSHIFNITQKSRFDTKSIAGNIIPAIASANATIAGLVVLYAIRVLSNKIEKCPNIHLRPKSRHSKLILSADKAIIPPRSDCYVCRPNPTAYLSVNCNVTTVSELENAILKRHLNMIAPDVMLEDKDSIIISSEEGECDENLNKTLYEVGIGDGSILKADDFQQNFELTIHVTQWEPESTDEPFKVAGNPNDLLPKEDSPNSKTTETNNTPADKKDSDDDLMVVDGEDPQEGSSSKKRKLNPRDVDDDDDDISIVDM